MPLSSRLSLRALCLGDDLRAIAPRAQRLGYHALQLDLQIGALHLPDLTPSGHREIRALLARHELQLDSLRLSLPPTALLTPAQHDRALLQLRRSMDAAAALQAPTLCLDLGRLPPTRPTEPPIPPVSPADAGLIILPTPKQIIAPTPEEQPDEQALAAWSGVDSLLREVGQLADRMSIFLAFSSELSSFASLQRAITQAACPYFGLELDPVSILRDKWNLPRILDELGSLLRHVRLRDALQGQAGRTQPAPLGQGSTNWPELFALLEEGGYRNWLTLDTLDLPNRTAIPSATSLSAHLV